MSQVAVKPADETPVSRPAWEDFKLKPLPELRSDYTLYNFQQFAIYKALLQRIFVIALSTGLGKTLCAYSCFFYYKQKFPKVRLLIVTNTSAVLQFRKELDKFFEHGMHVAPIHGNMGKFGTRTYAEARKKAISMWGDTVTDNFLDALVFNYATFRINQEDILREVKRLHAAGYHVFTVFDEATAFKNIQTQTHRAVAAVSKLSHRVLGLTATLTKGKLEEIYCIYKALGILLEANKEAFENKYCLVWQNPRNKHQKRVTGYKNTGEFVQRIKDISIVLRKMDVAKFLPAYTLRTIPVQHSEEQFRLISDIYSGVFDIEAAVEGEDDGLDIFDAPEALPVDPYSEDKPGNLDPDDKKKVIRFTETAFIRRALLDPRLVRKETNKSLNLADASPKTKEFVRLLTDEFTGEKVVFYTQSKTYLHLLRDTLKHLAREGILPLQYHRVLEVTGDVTGEHRERNKELFMNDPQYNLILINDAGLESINLQAASVLVVASLPRTGGDMVQLAGRLSRLGSSHQNLLLIPLLTEESQDEDEYLIINQQMQLMANIMGEAEAGLIDWELLKENAKSGSLGVNITQEELQRSSKEKLVFHQRKRRATFYNASVRELQLAAEDE